MRDVWHYKLCEQYNKKKFEGIINVNANIGYELAIKNPEHHPKTNPTVPEKLYYYPIEVERISYLLPSSEIDKLPIKVLRTTKISVGQRAYERIDEAASVKLVDSKEMTYRQFITTMLPYQHEQPKEWLVWKILSDVSIRDKIFIRAISYPAWAKTSTYYVQNELRNDIAIVDGGTFAKLKYSLSLKPSVVVLDEVDDVSSEERRFLAKLIRSCGDGRGKVNNDSRAVSGTAEIFDLTRTSLVALYNFPTAKKMSFFENNFHEKILDRMFPILLNGGSPERSALLHKHETLVGEITEQEYGTLQRFARTMLYFERHALDEIGERIHWKPKRVIERKRWNETYITICRGLALYAETEAEFNELEETLYTMHTNYLKYREQFMQGTIDWNSPEFAVQKQGQNKLIVNESEIL